MNPATGQVVVLIHGLPGPCTGPVIHWSMLRIASQLLEKGYRTVVYKYDGHRTSFDSNVERLGNFIQRFNSPILVGHSYGGLLACKVSERHKLQGIVTICAPLRGCSLLQDVSQTIPWLATTSKGYDHIRNITKEAYKLPCCSIFSISVALPLTNNFDLCLFRCETTADANTHLHIQNAEHSTCLFDSRVCKAICHFVANLAQLERRSVP